MSKLLDSILKQTQDYTSTLKLNEKEGVEKYLSNWLGDFVKVIQQHDAIDQEFERLKALPGIFCCYCGYKIFTELTPAAYMAKAGEPLIPPACHKCDPAMI